MRRRPVYHTPSIDWKQYEGFPLVTADSRLVGVVSGVISGSEDTESLLQVSSDADDSTVLWFPVSDVGVVSKNRLLLDLVAGELDVFRTEQGEFSEHNQNEDVRNEFDVGFPEHQAHPDDDQREVTRKHAERAVSGTTSDSRVHNPDVSPAFGIDQLIVSEPRGVQSADDSGKTLQQRGVDTIVSSGNIQSRLEIEVTRVSDRATPHQSRLLRSLERRTAVLEQLMLDVYMHGRSSEDGLVMDKAASPRLQALSESSEDSVPEVGDEEFEAFCNRSLAEIDIVYLFANSIYGSLQQQAGLSEEFLCTWCICSDGTKVLLHVTMGKSDSSDPWIANVKSLTDRGLKSPFLVVTDSSIPLNTVIDRTWPDARRVRCWIDKMTRVLDQTPSVGRPALKLWLQSIRDAPDYEQGQIASQKMIKKFASRFPDAMAEFQQDVTASLTHLTVPIAHRRMVRNANLGEQSFMDEKHRRAMLYRLKTDDNPSKVVYEWLNRFPQMWSGLRFTEAEQRNLGIRSVRSVFSRE